MPLTETRRLFYYDNDRQPHDVLQLWAQVPGTGVSFIVAVQPVEIDPNLVSACPTRPVQPV